MFLRDSNFIPIIRFFISHTTYGRYESSPYVGCISSWSVCLKGMEHTAWGLCAVADDAPGKMKKNEEP